MVIFEVNNSSSVHIDEKKKDVLLLGFDDTTVTVKAEYSLTLLNNKRDFARVYITMETRVFVG